MASLSDSEEEEGAVFVPEQWCCVPNLVIVFIILKCRIPFFKRLDTSLKPLLKLFFGSKHRLILEI